MKTRNMREMKKILLLGAMVLSVSTLKAQVSYFGNEATNIEKLKILKTTTTLFTLTYSDYSELAKFDEAIKKTWTITPYKIIRPEELAVYDKLERYSFFYFDAYAETRDTITNANVVYTLKLISPSDKPKQRDESIFAMVTLFPDIYTEQTVKEIGDKSGARRSIKKELLNSLYNNAQFINWSPGLLAGYLKQINDGLLAQESRELDYQFYNKVRLPKLATETLYVPEYVREVFSLQRIKLPTSNTAQEQYNYKLKFLPFKELDSLILNKTEGIKYLVYTRRSKDKIISIYDSRDDKIIYQKFYFQTPEFEMDDLNDIKKVVKSIK